METTTVTTQAAYYPPLYQGPRSLDTTHRPRYEYQGATVPSGRSTLPPRSTRNRALQRSLHTKVPEQSIVPLHETKSKLLQKVIESTTAVDISEEEIGDVPIIETQLIFFLGIIS